MAKCSPHLGLKHDTMPVADIRHDLSFLLPPDKNVKKHGRISYFGQNRFKRTQQTTSCQLYNM